jgi:hypothetical protein
MTTSPGSQREPSISGRARQCRRTCLRSRARPVGRSPAAPQSRPPIRAHPASRQTSAAPSTELSDLLLVDPVRGDIVEQEQRLGRRCRARRRCSARRGPCRPSGACRAAARASASSRHRRSRLRAGGGRRADERPANAPNASHPSTRRRRGGVDDGFSCRERDARPSYVFALPVKRRRV